MVMAQALYKALRRHSTAEEIHVVAPRWSRSLLARMPEISKIINLDVARGEPGLAKRYRLGRSLRAQQYSQAIILPRSFKSALAPWFANIPQRIGEVGEFRHALLTRVYPANKNKQIPTVCNYLRYTGIKADLAEVKKTYAPKLQVDADNQHRLLEQYKIPAHVTLVACMVGAEYGPAKQWPVRHFAKAADLLSAQGIKVCILGSAKETKTAAQIEALSKFPIYNLAGKTSLTDVIDLLAGCNAAVSNDSGLMHIAAAVNVPVVALYGATAPGYTPPLHAQAKSFYVKLACSPCWRRTCQYNHYRCLADILPQAVCEAVLARL